VYASIDLLGEIMVKRGGGGRIAKWNSKFTDPHPKPGLGSVKEMEHTKENGICTVREIAGNLRCKVKCAAVLISLYG
jgi:hypothetical protein